MTTWQSLLVWFGADGVIHSSAPQMTAHDFGSVRGSIACDAGPVAVAWADAKIDRGDADHVAGCRSILTLRSAGALLSLRAVAQQDAG
jgi:hypothetical protein